MRGNSLIYGLLASIFLRPRVPSWIWIRWIQYATHRNNFTSPPKLAMSTAMQYFTPTPNYFFTGQHFLETFTLLLETAWTTNSRWLQRFSPQPANTTFATLWRTYLPQHNQQCLNLTMHFSLRHLAAKILSPLSHNFISFPYFFPSYETCSISVNPLFHAAIKNLHIKHYGVISLIHLPWKLSEEVTKLTHARNINIT